MLTDMGYTLSRSHHIYGEVCRGGPADLPILELPNFASLLPHASASRSHDLSITASIEACLREVKEAKTSKKVPLWEVASGAPGGFNSPSSQM